jgi:hypothetical protein
MSKKVPPVVPPEQALQVLSTALQYCEGAGLRIELEFIAGAVRFTLFGATVTTSAGGTFLSVVPPASGIVPPTSGIVPPKSAMYRPNVPPVVANVPPVVPPVENVPPMRTR